MQLKTKLDHWLEAVIEAGWLAALVIAPLFFNVFSSRVFEPDKISLIRTIALIMLLAWLIKLANGGAAWLPAFARRDHSDPARTTSADVSTGDAQNDGATPVAQRSNRAIILFLVPIGLLIIAYLISTVLSVAPFVSWWGSYQRLQGTYTFLSYIIIALLAIAHLRQPAQIRRLQHAIILTSLPISIYGIIQHYAIDPLPWGGDVTTRVAANAGNAIFLAAYLLMAFFLTVERAYSSFAFLLGKKDENANSNQDLPAALAGGAYLFIILVQLLAIFWTQSRGPWIGLFAGIYLFILLLFTVLRPRNYRLLTFSWVGLGLAGAVLLVLMNTTPFFEPLRSVPYVGRLTTLLESDEGTGRVRVLIWQGAAEMLTPHEPLIFPDGSRDRANLLRPLVGYGPEAMWIAYNPFYPPELAHVESRNASPDRAHNETWDALVITGTLGFIAYIALFITIFYWALRWLGLLVNRRDLWLFAGILASTSLAFVIIFYFYAGGLPYFGVAMPAGLIAGLAIYVTLAAAIQPEAKFEAADLPRLLLIIAVLATLVAHFIEIHFGIAIAATRTYFWVLTALLVVLGMRWAQAEPYALNMPASSPQAGTPPEPAPERIPERTRGRKRTTRTTRPARTGLRGSSYPSALPSMVMTDLLIFLTLVFVYTTNTQGLNSGLAIFFASVTQRIEGGVAVNSPALFFLLVFTWLIAATIGLVTESLQQARAPRLGWWLRGLGLHAAIVWGGWLIYGAIQGGRLVPAAAGTDLDSQLRQVAGHFALFTWLVVLWIGVTALVYAWPRLRERRLPAANRSLAAAGAGVVLTMLIFFAINTVNIALVRADIIYKQGQQFDSQAAWVDSTELYRRALDARRTEDHYMLFLGRSLLEHAKAQPMEGAVTLSDSPTLAEVLDLSPQMVSEMGRRDLLRAAETVLNEAQRVNPLNTDHTANLARLYRTWADLSDDPAEREAMLDRSLDAYRMAVQLSPNAAHLWNETGNAHAARGERDLAEEAYLHSLSLDQRYDQTYVLLSDFYEQQGDDESVLAYLQQGIEQLPRSAQLHSYLGVVLARQGDLQGAAEANLRVLELQPSNTGAMRNLALIYRDLGQLDEAGNWAEAAIGSTNPNNLAEMRTLHQVAAQIYQTAGEMDRVITQYEQLRQIDPNDTDTLRTLYSLYTDAEDWNRSIEVLQSLSTLEPENFEHPLALAQILQLVGQSESAMTFANQALALAPDEQKPVISQFIESLSTGG